MTPKAFEILFIGLAVVIMFGTWVIARQLSASGQARAALDSDHQYRALSDEYRRLSDMAITAQEHADLRLAETYPGRPAR